MRAGPIVLLAKFLAYSNTITCSTLIAHCFLMLRRVGNLGIRYYFRWRLDLAAVHLTVALGRFAMDTSTVQQNGGCRIPWGRGEGRGGGTITSAGYCSTSFFCPSIYRRRRGSFRCASQCDTGLFPVKAMRSLGAHWHTANPAAATYRNCFPAKPVDRYASISHWPSWCQIYLTPTLMCPSIEPSIERCSHRKGKVVNESRKGKVLILVYLDSQ